ncbi:MAG: type IV toxin-antitoxin system AbiEi family antitoxin domain-containing protein [Gordonia sp. (in: high G+C Gram-positive bacteria)]|uniref:type IV toxin-antitoxin system AbiEi family antitoxin domain-containing protein n=1 Tax=Gordonia sp. (in: high G+C Gram-positive bacteria) TaxID=84139 RepID=UPI0039E69F4D
MGDSGELAAELACRDGVITTDRAMACGLTPAQIRHRVRTGAWKHVAHGVYRSASHEYSEAALVRAAVAAHGAVADRTTAAWWHGLQGECETPLTLAVRDSRRPATWTECPVDAIVRRYHPTDVIDLRGLAVTALAITVLTAAAQVSDGARVIDRALQRQPVTLADLTAAADRNAGLRGLAEARRLLKIAGGDTESAAERAFLALVKGERITGWVLQYRFGRWPVDIAWPVEKVAVEIDGWSYHHGVDQFDRDRRKRNALSAAHWIVLSFTWHQLTYEPGDCLRQLAEALAERRAELS